MSSDLCAAEVCSLLILFDNFQHNRRSFQRVFLATVFFARVILLNYSVCCSWCAWKSHGVM